MLGTVPNYTCSAASSPLLDLFEAAGGLPLPDTYEALESFIRTDHSHNQHGAGTPRNMLAKRLLKVLSGRYVGRFALWLYQEFLSSARRVVSHPQALAPAESMPLIPSVAQSLTKTNPSELHGHPARAELDPQNQRARPPNGLSTKSPPKPRQAMKRKSISDSDHHRIFRCDKCDQVFTGEYAENSYKRHMRRTKGHGLPEFQCHLCPTEAFRVDHYQNHMKKQHGLRRRRGGGRYYFESTTNDNEVAELEGSAGIAVHQFFH